MLSMWGIGFPPDVPDTPPTTGSKDGYPTGERQVGDVPAFNARATVSGSSIRQDQTLKRSVGTFDHDACGCRKLGSGSVSNGG